MPVIGGHLFPQVAPFVWMNSISTGHVSQPAEIFWSEVSENDAAPILF